MDLLKHLMQDDPAAPRLTVYNENTGARVDFSAQTLDNWVSKIANMLGEELDLEPGDAITIDLPVSWQAVVIALGACAKGVSFHFGSAQPGSAAKAVFLAPELWADYADSGIDAIIVTDDPFGRGVVESGGQLPAGAIDFGPTVRFYGDHYYGPTTALPQAYPTDRQPERVLSTGWTDTDGFVASVIMPLAAGGSAVVVSGLVDAQRIDAIADNEKVTARL